MKMASEKCMRIAIWRSPDFVYLYDDLFLEYTYLMQKSTGINVKILDKVDLGFNRKLPNGSWTGLLGMVYRGEADLALEEFAMTAERQEAVDFVYPYMLDEFTFATKRPEHSPEMFAFLNPFECSVWITLAVSLIFISVISFMACPKNYFLVKYLFHYFAAVTGQTTKIQFQNMCCRLMSLSWIVGMMLLANCYKSLLLSFLTVPTLKGIRDFKELSEVVQRGRYQCVLEENSILGHILLNSDIESYRILGENIEQSPIGYGDVKALFKNPQGNIAFICPKSTIMFLSRKFFISNDHIIPTLVAYAVRKTFLDKRALDKAVIRIADSGFLVKLFSDMMFRKSLSEVPSQSDEEEVTVRSLSLFEVSGVFILLISGYFVATIALAFEIFYYKFF